MNRRDLFNKSFLLALTLGIGSFAKEAMAVTWAVVGKFVYKEIASDIVKKWGRSVRVVDGTNLLQMQEKVVRFL